MVMVDKIIIEKTLTNTISKIINSGFCIEAAKKGGTYLLNETEVVKEMLMNRKSARTILASLEGHTLEGVQSVLKWLRLDSTCMPSTSGKVSLPSSKVKDPTDDSEEAAANK